MGRRKSRPAVQQQGGEECEGTFHVRPLWGEGVFHCGRSHSLTEPERVAGAVVFVIQSEFFVQQRYRGTSIRSKLGGGRTDEVRSLQFVPSLNEAATSAAVARVDIELSVNHRARDLGLGLDDHNF